MIKKTIQCEVYGEMSEFTLRFYSEEDIERTKRKFEAWKNLYILCKEDGDRAPNIPECISEAIYCTITLAGRYVSAKKIPDRSFDAFDFMKKETIQIKAAQIERDCTSFGPKSRWNRLVFMDFFNDGNIDGTVDIYEIPTELVHEVIVSKKENVSFLDRQEEGKRPRFSMRESIIIPNSIEPIYKKKKLW
jgi:hypothetical protein